MHHQLCVSSGVHTSKKVITVAAAVIPMSYFAGGDWADFQGRAIIMYCRAKVFAHSHAVAHIRFILFDMGSFPGMGVRSVRLQGW